jgi:hypothetical protein
MATSDQQSLRKRLKRDAERRHPGRPMGWLGGILYFLPAEHTTDLGAYVQVPGVQEMPGARGLAAAFVTPSHRERTACPEPWQRSPPPPPQQTTTYAVPGFREVPPRSFW